MNTILKSAEKKLKGEWLLTGGALLHALEINIRVTTDIDMVVIKGDKLESDLMLMDLAHENGLPVESINQAAIFFLDKIKGWREKIISLIKTKKLTIYRPNLDLYLTLKLNRLTESDMIDCLSYIDYCLEHDSVELLVLIKKVQKTSATIKHQEKSIRFNEILKKLESKIAR